MELQDTADVRQFMHLFDQTVRPEPTNKITPDEQLLRARLVYEEAMEFVSAMGCLVDAETGEVVAAVGPEGIDLVEATDALADIIVVTKGSAHTLGVPIDEAFKIVHDTNMKKANDGVVLRRADGKVMKPLGWEPPTEKLRELLSKPRLVHWAHVQDGAAYCWEYYDKPPPEGRLTRDETLVTCKKCLAYMTEEGE